MKAKVKETGEIIDVYILYPTTYSRLDGNHKIIEEYDEDELEFMPGPKMVSLNDICEYLKKLVYQEFPGGPLERMISDECLEKMKKEMEE